MSITLYPSNWLYNAGVIGFLKVLEQCGENIEASYLQSDGSVKIDLDLLQKLLSEREPSLKQIELFQNFSKYWWTYLLSTIKEKSSEIWVNATPSHSDVQSMEQAIENIIKAIGKEMGASSKKNRNEKEKKNKKEKFNNKLNSNENLWHTAKNLINTIGLDEVEKALEESKSKVKKEKVKSLVNYIINNFSGTKDLQHLLVYFQLYRPALGRINNEYKNMINNSKWETPKKVICDFKKLSDFKKLNPALSSKVSSNGYLKCFFCLESKNVEPIDYMYSSDLFPASGLPNSNWNNEGQNFYCAFCRFLLIHKHLGMFKTQSNEYFFINAPSFQLMWELNQYAEKILSKTTNLKSLLGLSLLEFTLQKQQTLHQWLKHNIEIVIKRGDQIYFFTLDPQVSQVLNDYSIASKLKSLQSMPIFSLIMNKQWDMLNEIAYQLQRAVASENMQSYKPIVNQWLPGSSLSKKNLLYQAETLLFLRGRIEEVLRN